MRSPEITEDEIQRLTETSYCSKPYGEAAPYRTPESLRIFRGIPPELVPTEMKNLIEWVNSKRAHQIHPLKRAAIFYARYDQIHPFYKHPWGHGTKHAARFFAAKIMFQGKNGVSYLPLMDDFFFMMTPTITERPNPYEGMMVFGGDPFGSPFGGMTTLQKLIEDRAFDEYLFNFLAIYTKQLKTFLYIHQAPEVPAAKPLIGKLEALFLSECKPEARHWFEGF